MFGRLEAAVESRERCFFVFVLPTFRSCAKKKNESEKLIKNIDRLIVEDASQSWGTKTFHHFQLQSYLIHEVALRWEN